MFRLFTYFAPAFSNSLDSLIIGLYLDYLVHVIQSISGSSSHPHVASRVYSTKFRAIYAIRNFYLRPSAWMQYARYVKAKRRLA